MKESCHIWTQKSPEEFYHSFVVTQRSSGSHTRMSHVTEEWDMSHKNKSCCIWMRDVTYKWDMSIMNLKVATLSFQCCNTLQHTATHCNTLQLTATHCNTLQHTATHCHTLQDVSFQWCNTLQHTATHCNTLQHTATHCNTLQHTATHCNTLQDVSFQCYCDTWLNRPPHMNESFHL